MNAAGILAKVRSPTVDNEAISVIQADGEARELYLTAVLHRVLGLDWDASADLAASSTPLSPDQLQPLKAELSNPNDSGARYCSVLLLSRNQGAEPHVTEALLSALRSEVSRENLRAIGAALAGINPLKI